MLQPSPRQSLQMMLLLLLLLLLHIPGEVLIFRYDKLDVFYLLNFIVDGMMDFQEKENQRYADLSNMFVESRGNGKYRF